jgi:hypothetical protein
MRLAELQEQMQAAILDPRVADPRLRVHRSHFWNRMRSFVVQRHPLLARFVGDVEIAEITERFIVASPPKTGVALEVSEGLAELLRTAEPWRAHPIIAELAAYDYQRTAPALAAEQVTVTPADVTDDLVVRLKDRSALVATRYRFHAMRQLRRTTPLDDRPTYVLVHMAGRRTLTTELDHRSWLAFEQLRVGSSVQMLRDTWGEHVFATCVDQQLLVAI